MDKGRPEAPLGAPGGPPGGPLDSFVARAKAARGPQLLQVLQEALLHPDLFIFGELLALDNVQQLGGPPGGEGGPALEGPPGGPPTEGGPLEGGPRMLFLLRLMASGTVKDLVESLGGPLGAPVPPQLLYKLRLLTIVSWASVSCCISFKELQGALEAPGCCSAAAGLLQQGGPSGGPSGGTPGWAQPDEGPAGAPDSSSSSSSSTAAAAAAAKEWLTESEVEEMAVTCLRLGLLRGRVDGELGCIDTWGAPLRDPTEKDIDPMLSVLKSFQHKVSHILLLLNTAKQNMLHIKHP
ncbi:hypothetical protein, conserved [Eimeria tenella]|uniref:PCI domain-containing protein n=1 Tax=Eimeria tenella TaxID=5802 RepID=U6L3J1_EIMTE|nr:hypothetical protein, conserved [Eimeria tenella]CDJ44932.1 hypothetical protein, conserved [Eimeria tenella]|eukprot:XP_013235679.1 hypothetical protein, conserved [Eimeria tenella]